MIHKRVYEILSRDHLCESEVGPLQGKINKGLNSSKLLQNQEDVHGQNEHNHEN